MFYNSKKPNIKFQLRVYHFFFNLFPTFKTLPMLDVARMRQLMVVSLMNNVITTTYRRLSGRRSDLGARLKNVISHRAVEERRFSPRGQRTLYLTGRFKNDASRRADEERCISRAGEERRISPGDSRMTYLAVQVKNAVSHRAVQERRI